MGMIITLRHITPYLLVLAILAFSGTSSAREAIRIDSESSALNRFVWRGDMWTDDPVFWQTLTLRYKGFRSYNFFNIDLTDINDDRYQINEYDYILDYTFTFPTFSIAPGVLHFSSPTDYFEPSTKITLEVKAFTVMNPRLRVRIDPSGSKGSYFIGSFSQGMSTPYLPIDVTTYGSLGMSEPRYYGRGLEEQLAFTDLLIGLGVPFYIGRDYRLTPFVEFTSLLGSHLREGIRARGRDVEIVTYGITLGRVFEF